MTYLCCLYILGDPSVWYGRNNLCNNSLQFIWQKTQLDPTSQYDLTSMDIYHLPRPTGDTPIDTSKAVILIVQR